MALAWGFPCENSKASFTQIYRLFVFGSPHFIIWGLSFTICFIWVLIWCLCFLLINFFFQRLRNGYFICQIKLEISYYIRLKPVFFWLNCIYILTTVSLNPWNILLLRDCSFYKLIISHFREQTSHVPSKQVFFVHLSPLMFSRDYYFKRMSPYCQ